MSRNRSRPSAPEFPRSVRRRATASLILPGISSILRGFITAMVFASLMIVAEGDEISECKELLRTAGKSAWIMFRENHGAVSSEFTFLEKGPYRDGSHAGTFSANYQQTEFAVVIRNDEGTIVYALNEEYYFGVENSGPNDEYLLTDSSLLSPDTIAPLSILARAGVFYFSKTLILGYPLEYLLLNEDDFTWLKATRNGDGWKIVLQPRATIKPFMTSSELQITLDSNLLVSDWEIHNYAGFEGATHRLQCAPTGPTPPQHVTLVRMRNGTEVDRFSYEFSGSGRPPNDEVFRLPYYGIPESAVLPPRPGFAWGNKTFLSVGFLFLLAAIILLRRRSVAQA